MHRSVSILAGLLVACGPESSGSDGDTGVAQSDGDTGVAQSTGGTTVVTTGDPDDDATTAVPTTGAADGSSSTGVDPTTGEVPECPPAEAGALLSFTEIEAPADGQMVWARGLAQGGDDVAYVGGALRLAEATTPVLVRIAGDGAVLGTHTHAPLANDALATALVRAPPTARCTSPVRTPGAPRRASSPASRPTARR